MNSNLFFFDQTGIRKRAKRQKKTPDELPQSLRFAHLNPRIAAFLRQQERARARAGEGDDHTPREGDGSNPTADGANIINLRDLKAGIGIGRGDGFFLPDIKDGSFSLPLLRTGYFDNNSNDGEEFTQRHLYQEAIFAAPMLLIQLGRILYLFRNEHLDLPRELVNLLLNSWIELISETQYTTREWQSQAYQEKAMNKIEEEEREKEQKDKEIKEAAEAEEAEKEKKKKKKKRADDDDESKKGMVDTSDGAPAILQYRKESKAPSVGSTPLKPKTRLERFKSMHRLEVPEARKSGRKVGGIDLQSNTTESHSEVAAQVSNREQPSFLQVINFTLSSRLAEERGWIIHPDEKDDLERQTIIEWASQRLQLCIKQTQNESTRAKELGADRPLTIRNYGDTKREAMMKYTNKKSSVKTMSASARLIPAKPQIIDNESRQKFLTMLPDGTASVFYPSGRIAICVSRCAEGKPGYYTLVYKDNPEMQMLAYFTPTGRGAVYHNNGKVWFLATDKGGHIAESDGSITKRWDWPVPHQKLPVTIILDLNEQTKFRCSNHQQMQIVFSCQKESAKFNVSTAHGAVEPKTPEDWGCLITGETFESKAAKEFIKPPTLKKKDKDKKQLRFRPVNKNKSRERDLAELQKILEFPDKNEYEIPAEKELSRLQLKIKNITEDWMEHYRIAVGISSPHLRTISSAPRYRKARNIQSAKSVPGTMPSAKDFPQRPYTSSPLPEPRVKVRAPSAPPTTGFHNSRPFSSLSSPSRPVSRTSEKRKDHVRIEIDGVQAETSKSGTPNTLSVASGSPVHGSPVHSAIRSHSCNRTLRATSTTAEHKPTIVQRGCPVALRAEKLGEENVTCKCSRHRMCYVGDFEYDEFITKNVPKTQIIVICVVSIFHPDVTEECQAMLRKVHEKRNKNRTRPCYESRHDRFKIFNYDMARAAELTENMKPLLLRRHNAVPGMFLMYINGKLMFTDNIFNGYGTSQKDFRAQILKTERDYLLGRYLPSDFRFTPSRGRAGPRSAWGGQIGGTGVNHKAGSGLPRAVLSRTPSSSTLDSKEEPLPSARSFQYPRSDSAAEFLTVSLSHNCYMMKGALRHSAPPAQKRAPPTVDFRKMETVK